MAVTPRARHDAFVGAVTRAADRFFAVSRAVRRDAVALFARQHFADISKPRLRWASALLFACPGVRDGRPGRAIFITMIAFRRGAHVSAAI